MQAIRWRMAHEPFRFSREIRLIPRWYVMLVVALYAVAMVVVQIVNAVQPIFPDFGRGASGVAVAGITTAAAIGASLFLFLFCYIYVDAKRREMKALLWLLLAIMVPYLIGVIIYFLMREPLPLRCPQCDATVSARFNFCPNCSCNLRPSCPQCKRAVSSGDHYCPNCAYDLTAAKPAGGESVTSAETGAPA